MKSWPKNSFYFLPKDYAYNIAFIQRSICSHRRSYRGVAAEKAEHFDGGFPMTKRLRS